MWNGNSKKGCHFYWNLLWFYTYAYYSQLLVPYYKYSVANNFKEFNQGDNADNGSPIYGSIPKTIEDNRKIYMGAINTCKSFSAIENKYVYDYSFGEEITVNASEIGQYQIKSLYSGNVAKTVTGNCYIVHNTELETMSNVKDFIVFEKQSLAWKIRQHFILQECGEVKIQAKLVKMAKEFLQTMFGKQ